MNLKSIKRGLVIVVVVGAMFVPTHQSAAAGIRAFIQPEQSGKIDENALLHAVAEIKKQENIEKTIKIETTEELRFNERVSRMVFARTERGYLPVAQSPEEESAYVGKVFADSTIEVVERVGEWASVRSGNVAGYVKIDHLIMGKEAVTRAKEILSGAYPEQNVLILSEEDIEAAFSVGETTAEEKERLASEKAAKAAAEKARAKAEEAARREKGKELVSYAKQFIGNPYVYGGTSLTRGTDCSGFVKGVYAHYGIELPRTSYAMRSVGRKVSFSEIQPGDIVCYAGHVAIYAGNGKNIGAIDENRGIGMTNTTYRRIITIRRIF